LLLEKENLSNGQRKLGDKILIRKIRINIMDNTFICLNSKIISDLIDATEREICFVAPGISNDIANAMVRCLNNNPNILIEVIIDDDPNVIRYGYGVIEAINTLSKYRITIRYQRGLRIGLISTDVASYIFNPTPLIIEEEPNDNSKPNAILISEQEAAKILQSIKTTSELNNSSEGIELGKKILTEGSIKSIKIDLDKRPPIKPDLFRQMNVISSIFQLVETHLTGARVQAKTFTLTPQDLGIKNKDVANRIRASYKIIEHEDILELNELESMLNNIKGQYFINIPKYGKLILYESVSAFNSAINELRNEIVKKQKSLLDSVSNKLQKSKELLIPLIAENLAAIPFDELRKVVFPLKPDKSGIKEFVIQKLDKKFPNAEKILSDIELTVKITNVSSQLIAEKDFREKIEAAFGKSFDEIVKIESAVQTKSLDDGQSELF
jgi:hypothetical protein